MKRWYFPICLILLALVTMACSSARPEMSSSPGTSGVQAPGVPGRAPTTATMTAVAPATASPPKPSTDAYGAINGSALPAPTDRMVVRNGSIGMMVENVAITLDKIAGTAASYGGYVVSSSSGKQGDRLIGNIQIRVAADKFNDAMKAIHDMAIEVTSETSTSQDVTQEYIDLTGRLKSLQATSDQLYKVLAQATKVEDILAIQREITNTQTQIEQTKGRMQYLERTSATSLIEVRLDQGVLVISFNADKVQTSTGDGVRFVSQVSGGKTPYTYQWDFGDGQTANEANPSHAYQSGGSYTVTLKVTDDKRNVESKVRENYLTVESGWNPGSVAVAAWNALKVFGQALVYVGIVLLVFSPVWLVIIGIVWFARRRKAKKNQKTGV